MTRDRDIERVLDRFYVDGPTEMPDRLFLGVIDRIERVPQRRLALQMTRFATMSSNFRLAAAAAIVVAVAGVAAYALSRNPSVATTPTPTPSAEASTKPASLPAALRDHWVGAPRVVPEAAEPPYRLGLALSNGDLHFELVGADRWAFPSSALLVDTNQIRLELAVNDAGCKAHDVGTYAFAVTDGDATLNLTPISDQCGPRAAALTGEWNRAGCVDPGQWCLGDLAAGAHVSTLFTPRLPADSWLYRYGALSYSVPAGWTNTSDDPSDFGFAQQGSPENTGIFMWSDVVPHSQAEMCSTVPEPGVGRDSAAITSWLAGLPGLVTSDPVPVTIGGLSGQMIDLAVDPAWTATCPYAFVEGQPLVSTFSAAVPVDGDGIDWNIQAEGLTRIITLDVGGGRALVIDIEGQTKADYDALLPEAMQVVNSFAFH